MTQDTNPASSAELAGLFRLASRLMARSHHRRDHAHHAQHRVLSILLDNGPMPQAELLEILDVRSSSLSELLRKLENRGLILRERNEEDRRGFIIAPTDQARALAAPPDDDADADSLFGCLDQTERDQLRAILTKLVDSLRDDAMPGGRGFGPGHGGRGQGFGRGGHGRGERGGRGRGKGFGGGRGRG